MQRLEAALPGVVTLRVAESAEGSGLSPAHADMAVAASLDKMEDVLRAVRADIPAAVEQLFAEVRLQAEECAEEDGGGGESGHISLAQWEQVTMPTPAREGCGRWGVDGATDAAAWSCVVAGRRTAATITYTHAHTHRTPRQPCQ